MTSTKLANNGTIHPKRWQVSNRAFERHDEVRKEARKIVSCSCLVATKLLIHFRICQRQNPFCAVTCRAFHGVQSPRACTPRTIRGGRCKTRVHKPETRPARARIGEYCCLRTLFARPLPSRSFFICMSVFVPAPRNRKFVVKLTVTHMPRYPPPRSLAHRTSIPDLLPLHNLGHRVCRWRSVSLPLNGGTSTTPSECTRRKNISPSLSTGTQS